MVKQIKESHKQTPCINLSKPFKVTVVRLLWYMSNSIGIDTLYIRGVNLFRVKLCQAMLAKW